MLHNAHLVGVRADAFRVAVLQHVRACQASVQVYLLGKVVTPAITWVHIICGETCREDGIQLAMLLTSCQDDMNPNVGEGMPLT